MKRFGHTVGKDKKSVVVVDYFAFLIFGRVGSLRLQSFSHLKMISALSAGM